MIYKYDIQLDPTIRAMRGLRVLLRIPHNPTKRDIALRRVNRQIGWHLKKLEKLDNVKDNLLGR